MKTVRNYKVTDKKLGAGGLGSVYHALRRIDGTEVDLPAACKVVRHDLAHHRGQQQALASEAILGLGLSHQNLVQVFDCIYQDETSYLFMEMIDGASLEELLAHYGRLPEPVILAIIYEVAQALQYLHAKGILHRDIAPANIIVSSSGEIKLLDLGFARPIDHDGASIARAAFACPFQVQTRRNAEECDLWALLVTAFYAVSGHLPFGPKDGDTRQSSREALMWVFRRAKLGDIAPLPQGISEMFYALLRDLMEPNARARRFRSARDLLGYLDQHIENRATQDMLAQCVSRKPGSAWGFCRDTDIMHLETQATALADTLPHPRSVARNSHRWKEWLSFVTKVALLGLPLSLVPAHGTSTKEVVPSPSIPTPGDLDGADPAFVFRESIVDAIDHARAVIVDFVPVIDASPAESLPRTAKRSSARNVKRRSFANHQETSAQYRNTDIPVNEGTLIPLPR